MPDIGKLSAFRLRFKMRCAYLCLDSKSSIDYSFNGAAIFISLSLNLQLQSQHLKYTFIFEYSYAVLINKGEDRNIWQKHIDTVTWSAQQCKSSSIYTARLDLFPQIFFFFNRGKHFIVLFVYLSLPFTLILILPNTHLHLNNYISTTTSSL